MENQVKKKSVAFPKPNVIERVLSIREDYASMTTKEGRKSVFVIEKLAKKYFLASRTIEDIVYCAGYYKNI